MTQPDVEQVPDDLTIKEVRELAKTVPGIERFYGVEPAEALTTPCIACIAGEFPEWCETRHTSSVVRLAEALGRSLAGPPGHPEAHPEWYIEDAAEIADDVSEGTGWVIEHDEGCLGEYFKVNGVEFWLDVNAEGDNPPVLAAEHRAELAEEESWNEEEL